MKIGSNTGFRYISFAGNRYVFQVNDSDIENKKRITKTFKILKEAYRFRNRYLNEHDYRKYVQVLESENEAYYSLREKIKEITDNY